MLRRLLKDSVLYSVSTFLSRGLALFMIPFFTRILTPEEYGVIDILTIFGMLATQVVTCQISQGIARFFADADAPLRRAYASSSLWFSVAMYGLFAVGAWAVAAPLSARMLNSPAWSDVFLLSVLAIIANGMFYFFQNQLRWRLQPIPYAISSLVCAGITAGMAFYAIVFAHAGVAGFFGAQIVGSLLGLAISWLYSRELYGPSFSSAACRELLAFSLPFIPSSVFVFATTYIDRIAIKTLMSVSDVGLYGIGFRLASVISLALAGLQGALTPLIYARYREESTPGEIARLFRLFLAACIPLLIFLSLFARELLAILTGPNFHGAWTIVPIVAVSSLLSSLYIFAPGLDIAKRTKTIALVNLGAALLNTGLNYVLIPILGIAGAALATCLGALSMFLGYWYFGDRHYPIPHEWSRLLVAAAILVLVTVGSLLTASLGWALKLGLGGLGTLAVTVVLLKRSEISRVSRLLSPGRA